MYNKIAFRAASIWYGIDSLESGMYFAPEWSLMFWQNKAVYPSKDILFSVYHFST
jgi:hypothetical protein